MTSDERQAVTVIDAVEARRYEARIDDRLAGFAEYRRSGGWITFIHTVVDPEFEGRGVGGQLARTALDAARAGSLQVVIRCPFFASWVRRHSEYADIVASEAPRPKAP